MSEWTVRDQSSGQELSFESRSAAEDRVAELEGLGMDVTLIAPDTDSDSNTVDVVDVDAEAETVQTVDDRHELDSLGGGLGMDQDPLDVLPGWMIDQVNHGNGKQPHLNKRGCQVIAEYVGLEIQTEAIISAHETDFEYAYYRATVTKPDGRMFVEHGAARVDGDDQTGEEAWGLDMQAETRAFKRGVKAATGGGLEAFAQERAND